MNRTTPWAWVPTLYFAQGIPYFIVNNISVLMFAKMGVPNGEMALFTSLLYLPWSIKPFWSPFVDIIKTKRWWTITMQLIMSAAFILLACTYLPWSIKPFWSPFVDIIKTKRWWTITMQLIMSAAFILLACTIPHPDAETIASGQTPISMFSFTLLLFIITAFASATHDIAADGFYMLALTPGDQSAFVGIRSTFYRLASIFGQGVLVAIAGWIELTYENIPLSWNITLAVSAILFSIISCYHLFAIPRPQTDKSTLTPGTANAAAIVKEFARTFATYFTKPGVWLAIAFMLLYRLPEAFLLKMCMPFLVASKEVGGLALSTAEVGIVYGTIGVIFLTVGGRLPEAFLLKMCMPFLVASKEVGGLALSTAEVGIVYGTIGVIFLTVGGILGGWFAAAKGLKKSLWWMAACMTLPCLTFVYLAVAQPTNIWVISTAIAIEQFGYGFGFTAYM